MFFFVIIFIVFNVVAELLPSDLRPSTIVEEVAQLISVENQNQTLDLNWIENTDLASIFFLYTD